MQKLGDLNLPDVAVMGVLNVTPDSFSDGGRFNEIDEARKQAVRLVEEGADIIDVGGESTRPGSDSVSLDEELARVVPVIEAVIAETGAIVSVDTTKPQVMREAAAAGAGMINDVRALQDDGALQAAAETGCAVCLMHMQGMPRTMQQSPDYDDVVSEVLVFLQTRVDACVAAGIDTSRLAVDPGFGFGKSVDHNLALLGHLDAMRSLGLPVLAGLSRKSTLGAVTGREVDDRMPASIVAAAIAVQNGASIVRVHDVAPTVDAIKVVQAVAAASSQG
ncbi:MAG: dihydropteroate synthase [Pseudomonadota bacterium]